MKISGLILLVAILVRVIAATAEQTELVTYRGRLSIGKRESTIVYIGSITGDMAAFCFTNKSTVGRSILSKCKKGQTCEFTGRVDWRSACGPGGNFSARARIIRLRSVKAVTRRSIQITRYRKGWYCF